MPSVADHQRMVTFIDSQIAKRGERKGPFCAATFTAKEILLGADMPNTENNWRYVLHVMRTLYPDSAWERGSRDEGFKVRVRVRTK